MLKMSSIKSHILWGLMLLLLVGGLPLATMAQPAGDAYQERKFDSERLERYRNDPDFQYDRAVAQPPEPPKDRKRVKERHVDYSAPRMTSSGSGIASLFKVFFWMLIIGAVVFFLIQMLKIRFKGLVKKKSDEAVAIEEVIDIEDIKNMEFEDPIKQAIDAGQFRKAVRLLYLKALRQLQDRSMIDWTKEKTNRQYLREIRSKELKPAFQDITFIFEYIWYGEFPVDKDHFNTAYTTFLHFDQTLRKEDEQ